MIAAGTESRRRLPILTLDEAKLSVSFGYVFDRKLVEPCDSIVSLLWKFARMNSLPGHLLIGQLCRAPVDPYDGIGAGAQDVDVRLIAKLLATPAKTVGVSLGAAYGCRSLHAALRYCPRCIGQGYHSVLHQRVSAYQCPIHRDPLAEGCSSCGHRTPYRLTAHLLDAPFRCANCRKPLGSTSAINIRPLSGHARTTITRAYLS
jgi:hypothetical protein